ncbi:MAG TPA: serine hydroxymethyltransferase [Bacillota bacterium]|nr:serine hydroxymethyltransferase [Bacillota bacterium]HOB86223.1 serine hydroxymethyltransferase [Bacillota bacterium]HOP68206.1 serine hydroxymethyltransferase [Bacillota bacterium]HPT33076.1 serine hydroxymethyltransferase [Bacillota bacterium]HPZ64952.1 serine hydroxymethyltransferase [Bacillota bacterium]
MESKKLERAEELRQVDPEVAEAIDLELRRQEENLVLIASENLASRAVLEAQGSVLTNKYAEGYPGARYYGGCEFMDRVEELARERARELFSADHVNVQPHSGASANMAVYLAVLKPGDRIMGMSLAHGGHLTHGSRVNISGRYFEVAAYGVEEDTGRLNMEKVLELALKFKPRLIVAGASAYPRIIDFEAFHRIAQETGALLMADIAHIAGLVAAGLHPNPVPVAEFVTTTTHKTLRGPRGGMIFCQKQYAAKIDKAVFPGLQGGPLMHVIAAKAVALKEAQQPEFKAYQQQVVNNARILAEELAGYGFDLVTGGTDTHLLLIDLRSKNITGLEAERLLDQVGITANKNAIPNDQRGPQVTSGLRLGTPTITSRGLPPDEVRLLASLINEAIENRHRPSRLSRIREEVKRMCREYPAYGFKQD